jgi:hypothetical protein
MLLTINFVTGVGSAAFGLVCRFLVFLEGDVTMVKVELTLLQSGEQGSGTTQQELARKMESSKDLTSPSQESYEVSLLS